jgi:hypothetical protein
MAGELQAEFENLENSVIWYSDVGINSIRQIHKSGGNKLSGNLEVAIFTLPSAAAEGCVGSKRRVSYWPSRREGV